VIVNRFRTSVCQATGCASRFNHLSTPEITEPEPESVVHLIYYIYEHGEATNRPRSPSKWQLKVISIGRKSSKTEASRKSSRQYVRTWTNASSSWSPRLYGFIHDAKRFLLYNRSIIVAAPLQIYWSALIFASQRSLVRIQFENEMPSGIKVSIKRQYQWSSLLQTLEGHTESVNAVAFSPDGKTVASGSGPWLYEGSVRLWDAATGAALQTLENCWINRLVFSRDGSYLETDRGLLYLQFDSASSLAPKLQSLCTIFLRGNWLTRGERNLIWLPFEYRRTCSASRDNLHLLGHASGKITFIKSCLL